MNGSAPLEHLRPIVDDWLAFQDAIERPEPTTFRVNRLRTDVETVQARLEANGFELERLAGQPHFLRVIHQPYNISDTFEHWAGLIYIQQVSSGLAAPLLGARPGESVLDLCAAPGGKTCHLAEIMQGEGPLVAAEVNEGRIRALLGNLYRLGHTNVLVVSADGRTLPTEAQFDRVLVDAPCSALGTLRKKRGRLPTRSRGFIKKVTRSQETLLRRAIEVTRPGGTVLYVTCTFGPEENEAVVSRVLADAPVRVDPLHPAVPHARGVTAFGDQRFDAALEGAIRIYPHHLDSGGMFICRLIRLDDGAAERHGWRPVPRVFPGEATGKATGRATAAASTDLDDTAAQVAAAEAILTDAWGVDPDAWHKHHWLRRGSNLWLHGCDRWPVEDWNPGKHWRLVALGLRGIDLGGHGPPRATNDLLQWLDEAVTKRRLELSSEGWRALLDGREVRPDHTPQGHVALALEGRIVGWGFIRDGRLQHHVPRGRAKWLRNVLSH
jgi:NOL1/NOP2/sun family putative RNA methylase